MAGGTATYSPTLLRFVVCHAAAVALVWCWREPRFASAAVLAILVIASAIVLSGRAVRQATALAAIAVLAQMIARYPRTANHELLSLVCLVLLALDSRAALRWSVPIVFVWSGIQKAISGCWFEGEFLAVSALQSDRFVYLQLIVPRAEMTALRALSPTSIGSGPFHFESALMLVISNGVWLAEIALPLLMFWNRARKPAAIALLVLLIGIEIFARELAFGALCAALLFERGGPLKKSAIGVLLAVALWPLVQIALVKKYGVDQWELWGFGMYTRPHLGAEVRAFANGRELPRTEDLVRFEDAWRHVGDLASPPASLRGAELRAIRLELDPETDRVVMDRRTLRDPRASYRRTSSRAE